jgi:hypothetical protein
MFMAFLILLLPGCTTNKNENPKKMIFWNNVRRGTNIFNVHISREDIRIAKKYGIKFVRLSLDKWPTKRRDFLIGDADNYMTLDQDDLTFLKKVLAIFEEEKMPVIITMLGLPGCRWRQHNQGKDDSRIWHDSNYQKQAIHFWKDLTRALRNYSIIVGYNILNEPCPDILSNNSTSKREAQRVLYDFYVSVVSEIREVEPNTPIILDCAEYADPGMLRHLRPINDGAIIYSFHMYEPYEYTNHKNDGKYIYPGTINGKYWDKNDLENYMKAVNDFQRIHKIQSNRILVGEFGGYRKQRGLPQYFEDLIGIFEKNGWHWAFYAFREGSWDGMDYEIGDRRLPWSYWKAVERGETPTPPRDESSPRFAAIKRGLEHGEIRLLS